MWTKFSNKHYPTITTDEYDYVYIESNEPCARMFIEKILPSSDNYMIIENGDYKEPTLINVIEYMGNYNSIENLYFRIRVITLFELQGLGLVTKTIPHVNTLIVYNPTSW